jgi:hypothetical protein
MKSSEPLRPDRTLLTVRAPVGIRRQPVIEIRVVDQPSGQSHQFEAAPLFALQASEGLEAGEVPAAR